MKAITESAVTAPLRDENRSVHNVRARLCNSNLVKTCVTDIIALLRKVAVSARGDTLSSTSQMKQNKTASSEVSKASGRSDLPLILAAKVSDATVDSEIEPTTAGHAQPMDTNLGTPSIDSGEMSDLEY